MQIVLAAVRGGKLLAMSWLSPIPQAAAVGRVCNRHDFERVQVLVTVEASGVWSAAQIHRTQLADSEDQSKPMCHTLGEGVNAAEKKSALFAPHGGELNGGTACIEGWDTSDRSREWTGSKSGQNRLAEASELVQRTAFAQVPRCGSKTKLIDKTSTRNSRRTLNGIRPFGVCGCVNPSSL